MTDASQPLPNARHERFAGFVAKGISALQAYVKAGYEKSSAKANAVRLMDNDGIRARIEWFQQQAVQKTLLTIKEKRQFLAEVVRTPVGDIGPQSPLCQKYVRTRQTVGRGENAEEWETERIEVPDKLKAIAQDNDLAGDGSEAGAADALQELMQSITARRGA